MIILVYEQSSVHKSTADAKDPWVLLVLSVLGHWRFSLTLDLLPVFQQPLQDEAGSVPNIRAVELRGLDRRAGRPLTTGKKSDQDQHC